MTRRISLISAVAVAAVLAFTVPAFGDSGGVHVSPDGADRAAALRQAEQTRIHFAREERAFAAKADASTAVALEPVRDDYFRTVTPNPVRDDYFRLDTPSIAAPTSTASSGREIEWPQIGIGFVGGVLLAVALLLAVRMPRVRQPAH
jgi:hypothetical protein